MGWEFCSLGSVTNKQKEVKCIILVRHITLREDLVYWSSQLREAGITN